MESMPVWGWTVVLLTVVIAAIVVGLIMWQTLAKARDLQARIDALSGEAARLPDAIERSGRAEKQVGELTESIRAATAREAALGAQLEEARLSVEKLTGTVAERDRVLTEVRETLEALQRTTATTTANLVAKLAEADQLRLERNGARESLEQTRQALEELQRSAAVIDANLTSQTTETNELRRERSDLRQSLDDANVALRDLRAEHATAVAVRDAALEAVEQTKAFLATAETQMRTAFTEAASRVFDEKSVVLDQRIKASADASKEGLETTLKPFAEKVATFQAKVEQLGSEQAREHATLVGTIGELKGLNQNMATATEALTRALKGNSKTRGDWGELILDTVLKASGLVEGSNYISQGHGVDEDSGQRVRPDVVVTLPDKRKIVVDSKVNLIAWSDAQNADSFEDQQEALVRHTAALRAHVRDLADKNYPRAMGPETLDLTVLFVPIEGALSSALSISPDLQTEAFNKRVVFASPNTLMAMLRVVERLWTRDKLQQQISTIGEEAAKLLDSLTGFIEDFESIDERLKKAGDAYNKAKNRLNDSPQSVVARARRLVGAGAKGKKALHESLKPLHGEEESPLSLEGDTNALLATVP
ncbi:DNA recombination protein RmuC [Xanthomonas campestris pv. campestris]|uniref:DNA recombination protein RmuC n=2 Tax=Xanthomonas TaxID=338 RepID=UPI00255698A0|nr:DNA recombination protein RmuC [Xanthomonas sp. LMC-A-07]MEB1550558.1 DNA recombination protein RmuC [Xanthomonas campestris pv. campestris]MEB1552698.1 DNA recombination protein RmuC [Xanthomonas campestris pv. campestris]